MDAFQADTSSDSSACSNQGSATSTSGSDWFFPIPTSSQIFPFIFLSVVETSPGYSEATHRENQVQLVTAFINSFCPGTKLVEDVGSELSYLLPVAGNDKKNYKKLFESLDASMDSLRISSYGISDTALEEVILLGSLLCKSLMQN